MPVCGDGCVDVVAQLRLLGVERVTMQCGLLRRRKIDKVGGSRGSQVRMTKLDGRLP